VREENHEREIQSDTHRTKQKHTKIAYSFFVKTVTRHEFQTYAHTQKIPVKKRKIKKNTISCEKRKKKKNTLKNKKKELEHEPH